MEKIRLQKFFSDNGIMSRRRAEAEIADGRVTVNGTTAVLGMKIDPETDVVLYNGKTVNQTESQSVYIMLNKPAGYVTTMSDEEGRPTVADLTADVGVRVYPVGRLDMFSEGLIIMTNDGDVANKLMHPSSNAAKVYAVRLKGEADEEQLKTLTSPMKLDGYELRPVEVDIISRDRKTSRGEAVTDVLITLHEGRNRQIRRMCDIAGLTVLRLRRIKEGDISLGNLPSGKWRYLTNAETEYLKSL